MHFCSSYKTDSISIVCLNREWLIFFCFLINVFRYNRYLTNNDIQAITVKMFGDSGSTIQEIL